VAQAPADLGGRVGLPVRAGAGHLAARQGLRDAVGARGGVLRVGVPVALALPEGLQAAPLVAAPAVAGEHRLGDRLRAAALGGGRGGGRSALLGARCCGLLSGPLLLGGLLLGRLLLRGPLLGGPLLGSTLLGLTLLGGPLLLGGDLLRALAHGLAGLRGGADGAGHLGGGPLAQLGVAGLAHLIDDEVDLADALLGHLGAGL